MIRSYCKADLAGVRQIYGQDEFARPALLRRCPRMSRYLADDMSYYPNYEPESLFVADADGEIVGALLGAVDTERFSRVYQRKIRPMMVWRTLIGSYGWPKWLLATLLTEWAGRNIVYPQIDQQTYPAHLHIGVLPEHRRKGIGTALMAAFEAYLRKHAVPGYHLYAASFHPLGLAFYQKLGMQALAQFEWRLHTGDGWIEATETVFARRLVG